MMMMMMMMNRLVLHTADLLILCVFLCFMCVWFL